MLDALMLGLLTLALVLNAILFVGGARFEAITIGFAIAITGFGAFLGGMLP